MKKEELLEIINSWENLPLVIKEMTNHPDDYSQLIEIALYSPDPNSWRAAYLVDKINDNFPELILPYLEKMIQQLNYETHSGKKRHFLKLISMNTIPSEHHGFLVDYCLNTLKSGKEPPAVRVHAMQNLYNISEFEPDLKPEILAVIEHEIEFHATAGITSRGSKLIKKLRKELKTR